MRAVAGEVATTGTLVMDPITTLYDLMEALQDQATPEDDETVTAAVVHLFNADYVKFLNISGNCEVACAH